MPPATHCLATVTSASFVPGTLVLIHSFLKYNRWFQGDVVVIHRDLPAESREYLTACSDRVVLRACSAELAKHIDSIVAVRPDLAPIQDRFLSLEAFLLDGYDRVVFLDSDILIAASFFEFFTANADLVACGDGAFYQGVSRTLPVIGAVAGTFNAGALSIGSTSRTGGEYKELLRLTCPATFRDPGLYLTDQALLNIRFAGRYERRGAEFNYLLAFREAIHMQEGIGLSDARAIHFNGPDKPWFTEGALRGSERDPVFASACAMWLRSYAECLATLSLLTAWSRMAVPGAEI
jgi:alpha-N-acetylglucosamine transferase